MPTTAGVGKQAQLIQGVFAPTVSIQNLGPGNVYLGNDSSVTKDNGWRLPENAMGTWSGGDQLWACSDGAVASLRIADSSLAFFTPGPDHVTIDGGTVTIGNASIPISGTVDIGAGTVNAIIDGPVSIDGSIVNVGNAITLNSSFRFLTVGRTVMPGSFPVGQADLGFSPLGGTVGSVVYTATGGNLQTLNIQAFGNSQASVSNRIAGVSVLWLDAQGGNVVSQDDCTYWLDGHFEWNVGMRSQFFVVRWTNLATGLGVNSVNIAGSTAPSERYYISDPSGTGSSFVQSGAITNNTPTYSSGPVGFSTFDASATATDVAYSQLLVPSRSGPFTVAMTKPTDTVSSIELKMGHPTSSFTAASNTLWRLTDASGFGSGTAYAPEAPIMVQVRSTATTGTKRFYGALAWSR